MVFEPEFERSNKFNDILIYPLWTFPAVTKAREDYVEIMFLMFIYLV